MVFGDLMAKYEIIAYFLANYMIFGHHKKIRIIYEVHFDK